MIFLLIAAETYRRQHQLALIDEEISEIEMEIFELKYKIDDLISKNGDLSFCHGFRTCEACALSDYCSWCPIDQTCWSKNSNCHFKFECTNQCEIITDCFNCVNAECGWCESDKTCHQDWGNCHPDLYFDKRISGKGVCPPGSLKHLRNSSTFNAYVNRNPTSSFDQETVNKQKYIEKLRTDLLKLKSSVQNLKNSRNIIMEMLTDDQQNTVG